MKIVGISGAYGKAGQCPSEILLNEALGVLRKNTGAECDVIRLSEHKIGQCIGCGVCMKGLVCPSLKDPEDKVMEIIERLYGSDAFIIAAPAHPSGGQSYLMTKLWTRLRIIFEKQHSKNWGVELEYISENPFYLKLVANIITFRDLGAAKASYDIAGRNETGYKYSTIASLNIRVGEPDDEHHNGVLSEFDLEAARGIGQRINEIITSELCEIFLQIICGENLSQ